MACVERQMILNVLGRKKLNSDMIYVIKSFSFETMKNATITNEARRRKNLVMAEATENDEYSCLGGMWSHTIHWGPRPFYLSDHPRTYPYYRYISASNCQMCGNYNLHGGNYPENILCFCHAMGDDDYDESWWLPQNNHFNTITGEDVWGSEEDDMAVVPNW